MAVELATDPVIAARLAFALATAAVALVDFIPAFRTRFLAYGSRAQSSDRSLDSTSVPLNRTQYEQSATRRTDNIQNNQDRAIQGNKPSETGYVVSFLDHLATYQVPHSYFLHFYLLSVSCSVFWLYQLRNHGIIVQLLAALPITWQPDVGYVSSSSIVSRQSMDLSQLYLCLTLMLAQGTRRLYECLTLTKGSKSQMWIAHWVLGLAFYAGMNFAIWIEGLPIVISSDSTKYTESARLSTTLFLNPLRIIGLVFFIIGSIAQHSAHYHLSTLPKNPYSLPTHFLFAYTLTPHYFAECIIYLSLALLAAPADRVINLSVLAGTVFTAVNLGITAKGTKAWYLKTFGKERVGQRWAMIPGVF